MARVAGLPDGRFVVAWVQAWSEFEPPYGSFTRLQLSLVDASGAPLGAAVDVSSYGVRRFSDPYPAPAIAVDAAGVVTVAWSDGGRILMRRYDASQAALQAVDWPADNPAAALYLDAGPGLEPVLAVVPGGLALVRVLSSTAFVVVALDRDGRPRGPEWSYSPTLAPGFQSAQLFDVDLTADETGRSVVVWHELQSDARQFPLVAKDDRLRAQRFAADGSPAGEVVDLVVRRDQSDDYLLGLTLGEAEARRDGTLLVTWNLGRFDWSCVGPENETYPCRFFHQDGDLHAGVFAADGSLLAEDLIAAGAPLARASGVAVAGSRWVIIYHAPYQAAIEAAALTFGSCGEPVAALCLANRFQLQVEWSAGGGAGEGRPLSLTSDTGAFWFFSPSNVELVAKVLDGTSVNGKHWVFFASLTDVELDLVVTDTATGAVKRYHNPQGTLASRADTGAFGGGASLVAASATSSAPSAMGAERVSTAVPPRAAAESTTVTCPVGALCLADGRFVVTAKWRLDGSEGAATPIGWTGETSSFWFFSPSNVELLVKVLDGRGVNGRFWLFYASLSDVDFDLEVLDTATGQRRTYHNPRGTMASRADVDAF